MLAGDASPTLNVLARSSWCALGKDYVMKNVIYSTTRQWNPGDEFILFGTQYLIEKTIGRHNAIIFNRHPQIRRDRKIDIVKSIDDALGKDKIEKFFDNSVKERPDLDYADLVVFAGSPEWRGRRLKKLYKSIKEHNLPSVFMGIGTSGSFTYSNDNFTKDEMYALDNAKLIICRDKLCAEGLSRLNLHQLPCPALFSSATYRQVERVKKIGIIYGSNKAVPNNRVSDNAYNFMVRSYKAIIDKFSSDYEIEFVAHYIDELSHFRTEFLKQTLRYSYDAKDYRDIFSEYDLIISHRVHGIGMCASMGTPGIMIDHTPRSDTVRGFLGEMVKTDISTQGFMAVIEKSISNISSKSLEIIEHRKETEKKYLAILKEALG